jgi:hypothetical protein
MSTHNPVIITCIRGFSLVAALICLVTCATGAMAQGLALNPTHSFPTDFTFTVDLTIDCAGMDVKGIETALTFDPSFLHLDDVTPGPWFTGTGQGFYFFDYTDIEPQGNIHIACSVLDGTNDQDAVLATLQFTATGFGNSPVDFTEVDVRDNLNATLPFGHSLNDQITIDTAIPSQPLTFGYLKAIYR